MSKNINQKLIEKQLFDSEKRYRSLFENMSEGFAYCKMLYEGNKPVDWLYLKVNSSFESLTGLLNVEGKLVSEVIPGITKNDPELLKRFSRVSLSGIPEKFEILVESLNQWFQISVYSPDKEYFVAVFDLITDRKITEYSLKKQESLLLAALKLADLGYWEYDIPSDEFTFNDQFYSILHTTAENEGGYKMSSFKYAERFVHPDDKKLVGIEIQQAINTTDPDFTRQLEHKILYADCGTGYISVRFFVSLDDKGKVVKTFGVNQDITERKTFENKLLEAKEHAERTDRLKDAFIANISHEIRTPLNGILGMTELIKNSVSKYLQKDEQEYFTAIDYASKRIIRTIDMILNFSRLQIGDFKIIPVKLNLAKVLHNIIKEYVLIAESKGIALTFENKAGLVELYCDEYCLGNALSNLVDNSIKYTSNGGIKIRLDHDKNNNLIFELKDTGIGISEEYLPHIFEPYSQEETGYNRSYEGVGLGMSLVKKYLEMNSAEITIQSQKNIGTEITIIFDINTIVKDSVQSVAVKSPESFLPRINGKQKQLPEVLVVEDDSINQLYIRSVLRNRFTVQCVFSAVKALELLSTKRFDIILMDISLKGDMNGIELTKLIKADENLKTIPVVAVTGHTSTDDIQNCFNAGCDEFLSKPFSDTDLLEKINEFLDISISEG